MFAKIKNGCQFDIVLEGDIFPTSFMAGDVVEGYGAELAIEQEKAEEVGEDVYLQSEGLKNDLREKPAHVLTQKDLGGAPQNKAMSPAQSQDENHVPLGEWDLKSLKASLIKNKKTGLDLEAQIASLEADKDTPNQKLITDLEAQIKNLETEIEASKETVKVQVDSEQITEHLNKAQGVIEKQEGFIFAFEALALRLGADPLLISEFAKGNISDEQANKIVDTFNLAKPKTEGEAENKALPKLSEVTKPKIDNDSPIFGAGAGAGAKANKDKDKK